MQEPALTVGIQEPLPKLPDLSIAQLLSIRHDEAFSNARRRKKGPKSAVSAFAYFNAAKLEGVVNECSDDMEPHRIVAVVAERWEALSDQDRAIYDELAAKDQLRYEMQCRPSNAKALELAAKKSKKRKHPGAPKHPKSAYLFFVGENRDTIKGEATPEERNSFTAIAKILGEKWKHLPEEQKDMYQKMADDDKERYRQEKIAFLQRRATITLEEEEEQAQSVGSDHPVEIEEEQNGETCTTGKRKRKHPLAPKHPLSAYLFFVATHRAALTAKYTDKTFTEVAKIIGDIWQQMTPAQRRKYEILASADKKRYEFEMRAWSKSSSNPQNDADQRNQTGNGTHSTSENGVIILGKRQRDHEAAQTISSMAAIGGPTTDKTKKHAISNVSDEPQPVLESYGHNSLESSQYESPAYRAFVKSESEYILSVDPDIDPAELDAALRLTWMEMSAHEKLAFVLGDEQASEQAAPESDRAPLPKDISEWTSEHVAQYVADDLGFSQYYQAFLQSSFTGSVLPTITTAILKKELGITILSDRKAIKTAFDALLA